MQLGKLICITLIIQIKCAGLTASLCSQCSDMLNRDQCERSQYLGHNCLWSFYSCGVSDINKRILSSNSSSSSGVVSATACAQYLNQSSCSYYITNNGRSASACKWVDQNGGTYSTGASGIYGCANGVASDISMANCVSGSNQDNNQTFYTYSTHDSVCTACGNQRANILKIAVALFPLLVW